jgi:hypothetical protein
LRGHGFGLPYDVNPATENHVEPVRIMLKVIAILTVEAPADGFGQKFTNLEVMGIAT